MKKLASACPFGPEEAWHSGFATRLWLGLSFGLPSFVFITFTAFTFALWINLWLISPFSTLVPLIPSLWRRRYLAAACLLLLLLVCCLSAAAAAACLSAASCLLLLVCCCLSAASCLLLLLLGCCCLSFAAAWLL